MSTPYQVTIQLPNATLQSLTESGYSLFVFHPIQTTAAGGQPVLWIQVASLATSITIQWMPAYAAYISQSPITTNSAIAMESSAGVQLGQILEVAEGGSVTVTNDGPPDAMSVLNTTSAPYTCGLALVSGSVTSPIAAFPLYGNSMDAMAPIEQAFVLFESYPATAGKILERTLAQGLLVDLTGVAERVVGFDVNNGWTTGNAPWATTFPANTPLSQILIHQAPLQLSESVAKINASGR
jgi:hypothetical protein